LLGVQVDLLGLSDLFEDILDDHSIVDPNITISRKAPATFIILSVSNGPCRIDSKQIKDVPRSQLDVVVALNDVDVEFPLGRGDEDSLIDFELHIDRRKVNVVDQRKVSVVQSIEWMEG
jgi:hypothetical protein